MTGPMRIPVWSGPSDAEQTEAAIDEWLTSDAMRQLANEFGFRAWGSPDWRERLSAFTASYWEFRTQGQERDLVHSVDLSDKQRELVIASAQELGLMGALPPQRQTYDVILILGGLVRACLTRPAYAQELLTSGLRVASVVALGAFRPLSPAELKIASTLGLEAEDEYDSMVEGMARSFGRPADLTAEGPATSGDRSFSSWCVSRWTQPLIGTGSDRLLGVVAAPSGEPTKRRAHSAETYDFWATRVRKPSERTVLLITNPIYVPYQGSAAIRRLGLLHGLEVETVGISDEAADLGQWTQEWGAQQYLQEIGSAVRGFVDLRKQIAQDSWR